MGLFKKAVAVATGKISPPGAFGGAGRTGGCVGVDLEFAFVDVETTGLEPWKDRVIEIGIVITDGLGRPIDQWCSLVNPRTGDAGPTRIHLIEASWLAAAPTFGQLAGDIAQRLSNRVMVCHNSAFDAEFLDAEYARAGIPIADLNLPTVDTMTLANTVGLPRGLQKACMQLGYYYDSHNALDDAIACAELFHRLAPMIQSSTFDGVTTAPVRVTAPPFGKVVGRQQASAAVKPRSVLSEFTQYLHAHNPGADHDDADLQRYRNIVIGAIEDGYIDEHEQYAMASTGHRLGLSAIDVADLHYEVILGMIDAALEDRRISKDEKAEIERAAVWLDVDLSDWDQLVKASRKRVAEQRKEFASSLAGKTVVFSGRGIHPNNLREALAIKHGMDPKKQISSKTDLVVIGSAEVDNATVQTARSAGIPIVIEATLWQRLGET